MPAESRSTAVSTPTVTAEVVADRPEVVVSRMVDVPRVLVFAAWVEPQHLGQWFAPRGFTTPVSDVDARPGGTYRIVMRGGDGVEYPISGIYRELREPELLVMTMDCAEHPPAWHDMVNPDRAPDDVNPAGEILTTVTFEDLAGRTRLTIRQRYESVAIRDAMVRMGTSEGWGQCLERLAGLLATADGGRDREIVTTRLLDAPRQLVFRMFTEPAHVVQWWGPNGFTTTVHEMDARPGGSWRFVMHGPDGVDYQNRCVYIEVLPPVRLAYDHLSGPRFRATITMDDEGGRTRLTMRMVFATVKERNLTVEKFGAIEGAKQTVTRLAGYLAEMASSAPHSEAR